jgi:hypothetical protein
MYTVLFSLLTIIPTPEQERVNYVNVVEVNSFYDEAGRLVFDQLIVRDMNYRVREWFILPNRPMDKTPEEAKEWANKEGMPYIPPFTMPTMHTIKRGSKYHILFYSRDHHTYYFIANSIEHTHGQYDPELLDREYFPKESRVPCLKLHQRIGLPPVPTP